METLENFRAWFTPRKRLWTGIGLFALTIVVPAVSPGTSVSWLIGPAGVFSQVVLCLHRAKSAKAMAASADLGYCFDLGQSIGDV